MTNGGRDEDHRLGQNELLSRLHKRQGSDYMQQAGRKNGCVGGWWFAGSWEKKGSRQSREFFCFPTPLDACHMVGAKGKMMFPPKIGSRRRGCGRRGQDVMLSKAAVSGRTRTDGRTSEHDVYGEWKGRPASQEPQVDKPSVASNTCRRAIPGASWWVCMCKSIIDAPYTHADASIACGLATQKSEGSFR
jgi:hypothetical protein